MGESANRRLCDAGASEASPAPDVVTFNRVTRPTTIDEGVHAPGLRFGDRRVMAVLAALAGFLPRRRGVHQPSARRGGLQAARRPYGSGQATYDLRRLKRKGLIERIPHTPRYQLTDLGRQVAVVFTKTHDRTLAPGLAHLDPRLSDDITERSLLATAWRRLERTFDDYIRTRMIAA